MAHLTVALENARLDTGSIKSLLDGGFLYLYSGAIPATAAAAATGTKLVKISKSSGATGISFASAAAGGKLDKNSDVWSGSGLAAGTATFFRFCLGDDDGSGIAGSVDYRLQGTAGESTGDPDTEPELSMASADIAVATTITIDDFTLADSGS